MPRWVKVTSLVAVLLLVAGASAAAWGYWRLSSNLTVVDIDGQLGTDRPPALPSFAPLPTPSQSGEPVPLPTPDPSPEVPSVPPTRILVLGSDSRQGAFNSGYGDPSVYSNERSDVTMLVQLAADRSWAEVVSVPRDLMVSVPTSLEVCGGTGSDTYTRFNAAFQYGGPACTVAAFEKLSGVRVEHTVVVDFEGFASMVDALGGLNVCLNYPVSDVSAKLNLPAGLQTLNGTQALSLARARKSIGTGSDVSRIARQQHLLRLLVAQVQNANVFTDAPRLFTVADAATRSLTLSSSLGSLPELTRLASSLSALKPANVVTVTVPWVPDPANPMSTVVLDQPEAQVLFTRLASGIAPSSLSGSLSRSRQPSSSPSPDATGSPSSAGASSARQPVGPRPTDESSVRSLFCAV